MSYRKILITERVHSVSGFAPQKSNLTLQTRICREDGAWISIQGWNIRPTQRTAVLILDGIGCSGWAFERIIPPLSQLHPVLTIHYRGHGRSPQPPRPWRLGMEVLAHDVAAACEYLGFKSYVVVGFSMGFQVALELFRHHKPLVAGLMSIAGSAGRVLNTFQNTHIFQHALPVLASTTRIAHGLSTCVWRSMTSSAFLRELALRFQVNTQRINSEDVEFYARQIAAVGPELFLTMLEEAHTHDAFDLLPRIDVPTRILAGARDTFIPLATMRKLAFAIPKAQWKVYPDATHALPAEFPEKVVEDIDDFVNTIVPS